MALTNLPVANRFTDGALTNIQAKNSQNDMLAFTRQSALGGEDEVEYTIATGVITPDGVSCSVDTEGDASSDNLDNITLTNIQDGGFLMLRAENAGRTVVIRHGQGGSGQILTSDGQDIILDDITKWLLVRRDGANIREVFRTEKGLIKHAMPNIKTDNYIITLADIGQFMIMNSGVAKAFTLPAIDSENDGAVIILKNIGTADLTITPVGGDTTDIATIEENEGAIIVADFANTKWRLLTSTAGSGGFSESIPNIQSANYNLLTSDVGNVVIMNEPTTPRTITFPAISAGNDGAVYLIKNIGVANCTLAKTGGDTIEVTSLNTTDAVIMVADNTNKAWRFLSYYTTTPPSNLALTSQVQGCVAYFNGTIWVILAPGTSGQYLKTKGAGANPEWGEANNSIELTASGSWTAPAGITTVLLTMVGGGGGGAGGSSGQTFGGSGGCGANTVRSYPYKVVPGNSYNFTIGAVGAGGGVQSPGGVGGDTIFDTGGAKPLRAQGGLGGNQGTAGSPGSNGSPKTAQALPTGNYNGSGSVAGIGLGQDNPAWYVRGGSSGGSTTAGGGGGATPFSNGAPSNTAGTSIQYGVGGGGAPASTAGKNGGPGFIKLQF